MILLSLTIHIIMLHVLKEGSYLLQSLTSYWNSSPCIGRTYLYQKFILWCNNVYWPKVVHFFTFQSAKPISVKEQLILAYGGLRGAVGFSLVYILECWKTNVEQLILPNLTWCNVHLYCYMVTRECDATQVYTRWVKKPIIDHNK